MFSKKHDYGMSVSSSMTRVALLREPTELMVWMIVWRAG